MSGLNAIILIAAVIAVVAILVLLRQPLARALRLMLRPLRGAARKAARRSRGGVRPRQVVGQGALASIGHVLLGESQIDHALHDFEAHAKSHLRAHHGIGFRWLQPLAGYIALKPEMSENDAKAYFEESRGFFCHDTPVFEDPNAFYEEIEGRHIIEMFGPRDYGAYYFLNGVRRTVNANVRILTLWASVILSAFVLFAIALEQSWIPFGQDGLNGTGWAALLMDRNFLICASGAAAIAVILALSYLHHISQQNAGRELNAFLVGYFAILGQQYIAASAECGRMYNNFSTKAEAIERSKFWFLAMEWIAFRQLFIENFTRNAIYQVQRNSSFYVFYIPILFALTFGLTFLLVSHAGPGGLMLHWGPSAYLAVAFLSVLIAIYFYALHDVTKVFHDALTPDQWNGFSSRNHLDTVAKLVGQYNGEIVYQRARFQPQG